MTVETRTRISWTKITNVSAAARPKRIFVVSSKEGRRQAECFIKHCHDSGTIEYRPWWTEFQMSEIVIDELHRIKDNYDGALVVLTPDMRTTYRRKRLLLPNLNVVFEWGFFLSKFSKANIAVVKYGNVHVPSDLGGWILIHGSERFGDRVQVPVKRTKDEFRRWLSGLKQPRGAGEGTSASKGTRYDSGTMIPSSVIQLPEGTVSVWANVNHQRVKSHTGSHWMYLVAHATDPRANQSYGRYPNAWAICCVDKSGPNAPPEWRFYSNGESHPQTELRINRRLTDGWHMFTVSWSRSKNVVGFSIDDHLPVATSFENWPLNFGNQVTVGNWVAGMTHAYPEGVGPILCSPHHMTPDAVSRQFESGRH